MRLSARQFVDKVGGGRLVYDADERRIVKEYHHKDHLGNVRVAFTDRNEDGKVELLGDASEITQQNDFYPFGLGHEGFGLLHGDLGGNRYRFNGKELNEDLGLYDYGARWYDPAIGRWGQIDPLAEAIPKHSAYAYTFNNPISFNDPTGMMGENPYGLNSSTNSTQQDKDESQEEVNNSRKLNEIQDNQNRGGYPINVYESKDLVVDILDNTLGDQVNAHRIRNAKDPDDEPLNNQDLFGKEYGGGVGHGGGAGFFRTNVLKTGSSSMFSYEEKT